jgi:hypothetical protein
MNIKIDSEFQNLIPAITTEEAEELEKSILEEGCRDALIIWDDGTLLDGHNRFAICQRHDLKYKTITKSFESRDSAKEWIIRNQLGRRNLSTMDRANLAMLLKPLIEEKAKEKEITHTNQGYQKSGNPPIHTDKELAKIAGVSHDTIHKAKVINNEASPEQMAEIKTKKKSIHKVYQEIKGKSPDINPSKEVKKKKDIEKDSGLLLALKHDWKMATPKDHKKFLEWLKENKRKKLERKKLKGDRPTN